MKRSIKLLLGIFILISLLMVLSCDDNSSTTTKPSQVADPVLSSSSGVYSTLFQLEIHTTTNDAEIYYTLDDSEPTESSQLYSQPIDIFSTVTIKARAFKSNYQASNIITANYVLVLPKVATPTFSPIPGDYDQVQIITLSCATPEAVIYYTRDGSEPIESSTIYTDPIDVNSSGTIKARAFKTYYPSSDIAVGEYEITNPSVAIPVFDPTPGIYNQAQSVSLTCYTPGAEIHYTTDGSQPTSSSQIYSNPIIIDSTTTVRAFALKDTFLPSRVITGIYEINYLTVPTPVFNPLPGDYVGAQLIRLNSSIFGETIYYTLDGSEPTESSLLYINSINIDSTTTIKARAYKQNYLPSEIAVGVFNIF